MEPHSPASFRSILFAALAALSVAALAAGPQQTRPQPPQPPSQLKPQTPPASPRLPHGIAPNWVMWKSQSTGHVYRVRIEGQTLYAEWVDLPPGYVAHGAYIRTECRKVGDKWIGTSRSVLPCAKQVNAKDQVANWCPLVTRTEIDTMTPDRITGHGESVRNSDCASCKVLEKGWVGFVWAPVKQKAVGSKQSAGGSKQ